MRKRTWLIVVGLLGVATAAAAMSWFDFGLFQEHQLRAHSVQLFGIVEPLRASSTASVSASTAEQDPTSLITVAKGLRVRVVTAAPNAGANIDMMALWPDDRGEMSNRGRRGIIGPEPEALCGRSCLRSVT